MESNGPRRFDEQEISKILEHASQLDADDGPAEPKSLSGPSNPGTAHGMTLAELQSIGEEAGISKAAVARAAGAIVRGDHLPPERQSLMGLPVGVARTVVFDRQVTDVEWERMVVLFRRTFGTSGVLRGAGSLREWGNGRLRASLEPTAQGGHQLRLSTTKSDAGMFNLLGTVFSVLGLSLTGLVAVKTGFDPSAAWFGPMAIAAGGLMAFARNAIVLPRWFTQRATQMASISAAASEIVSESTTMVERET
ncbi:hypothetical protein [Gemmatimonas groenlandica]|nr:hypothetical protein [Gemmatimonas groenlandica]